MYKCTLQSNLGMTAHIDKVLAAGSSSLYALRVLRSHGLQPAALHDVTMATTVAHIIYASPAWWGYTSKMDRDRIDHLFRRLIRGGFLPATTEGAAQLIAKSDDRLFQAIIRDPNHVLQSLLPPTRNSGHNLRARPHIFTLPLKDDRNFMSRLLYKNTY